MARALNLLRPNLHYRRECFDLGLKASGFKVVNSLPSPEPGDALVIWNRYGAYDEVARHFERKKGIVFVAENGYLGKHWREGEWFALALNHHAGAGEWHYGGASRWDSWSIHLAPYKEHGQGNETLILGQRGIGESGVRSPDYWAEDCNRKIGNKGRIRQHPGSRIPAVSLEDDLKNAARVMTWNSSAAFHALILGIPVWYEQKQWLGSEACRHLSLWKTIADPRDAEARLFMFRRMAWTLWTLDEIRRGEAFLSVQGKL